MRTLRFVAALAAAVLTTGIGQAQAGLITGLYGTGENASGAVIASGTDIHYTVGTVAGPNSYIINSASVPGLYATNDAPGTVGGSAWISADGPTAPNEPIGSTTYVTTFTDSDIASPSSISGLIGADDNVSILLNGVVVGSSTNGFVSLTSFSITSTAYPTAFISGTNTLSFVVYNASANTPESLRVTINTVVPEPASLALTGLGLGLVGLVAARRRKAAVVA